MRRLPAPAENFHELAGSLAQRNSARVSSAGSNSRSRSERPARLWRPSRRCSPAIMMSRFGSGPTFRSRLPEPPILKLSSEGARRRSFAAAHPSASLPATATGRPCTSAETRASTRSTVMSAFTLPTTPAQGIAKLKTRTSGASVPEACPRVVASARAIPASSPRIRIGSAVNDSSTARRRSPSSATSSWPAGPVSAASPPRVADDDRDREASQALPAVGERLRHRRVLERGEQRRPALAVVRPGADRVSGGVAGNEASSSPAAIPGRRSGRLLGSGSKRGTPKTIPVEATRSREPSVDRRVTSDRSQIQGRSSQASPPARSSSRTSRRTRPLRPTVADLLIRRLQRPAGRLRGVPIAAPPTAP